MNSMGLVVIDTINSTFIYQEQVHSTVVQNNAITPIDTRESERETRHCACAFQGQSGIHSLNVGHIYCTSDRKYGSVMADGAIEST